MVDQYDDNLMMMDTSPRPIHGKVVWHNKDWNARHIFLNFSSSRYQQGGSDKCHTAHLAHVVFILLAFVHMNQMQTRHMVFCVVKLLGCKHLLRCV